MLLAPPREHEQAPTVMILPGRNLHHTPLMKMAHDQEIGPGLQRLRRVSGRLFQGKPDPVLRVRGPETALQIGGQASGSTRRKCAEQQANPG